MWYVIEHFKDLDSVLKKISEITKKGGIFAFSTPSGEGVSMKTDPKKFYLNSPMDHYTIWEPSKAAKILKKYGFEVLKIVSTGHHPERFPEIKKTDAKKGSFLWKIIDLKSRQMKLGDTFEIYCRKK
jgi:2-polyprenyl-3-methyl-5-hydroxy-6-metoxy-1,4-benzoquinol methylase